MSKKLLLVAWLLLFVVLHGHLTNAQTSQLNIPSTIKVFVPTTYDKCKSWKGIVETVDFKDYVKNVLTNEWAPTREFSLEALKTGAVAIKTYAVYLIQHPKARAYVEKGAHVRADACDQVYRSGRAIPPLVSQAVDETWEWILTRNNAIISSLYIDGSIGSPNLYSAANKQCYPGRMSQWGSQYWANQGKDWQWMLHYYYSSVEVTSIYTGISLPAPVITAPPPSCDKPLSGKSCNLKTPTLFRMEGDPIKVYWYQNKKYYHVIDEKILNAMNGVPGWLWDQICVVSLKKLKKASPGPEFIAPNNGSNGIFIRQQGTDPVYRVENGQLRHISYQECQNLDCWDDVINVTPAIPTLFSQIPVSPPTPPISLSCKASPKISVKPKSGSPGTPFTVKWKGFSDNGTLISHLQKPDGTEYPTKTFSVDSKGKAEFVINSSTFTPGQYNLWAEDTCTGKRTKIVSFTVEGSVAPPVQPPPQTCPPGTVGTPPSCQPIQPQPIHPLITLSPTSGTSETTIYTVIGQGFTPRGTASLFVDRNIEHGVEIAKKIESIRIDELGRFSISFSSIPEGGWAVYAIDNNTNTESNIVFLGSVATPPSPQPPITPPLPVDSDNDGIPDNQDQCPYQWGPAPTGCPTATQPPPTNQPPWAQITVFPTTVNVGEFVTIQLISYGDPEGQPLVFDYDFGDGTVIPSPAAGESHSYSQPGTYTVRAKVRDPQGAFSYTNSVTVTVMGSSSPPPSLPPSPPGGGNTAPRVVDLQAFPSPAIVGERVVFTAVVFDQETPNQLSYYWSFGAGEEQGINFNTTSIDYIYHRADVYTVCLLVVDPGGLDDNLCTDIDVLPPFPGGFSLRSNIEMIDAVIYDAKGKLVYRLEELPPRRRWQWDMIDSSGVRVPNGVYLAVITVRDLSGYPIQREVKKIVVLR